MSENQNKRQESILDDPSLALKGNKTPDMEGIPTLKVSTYENNPRFVVNTKVTGDRNNGRIEAKLSSRAFFATLEALREVATSEKPIVIYMDNKGHRFADGKRDPNPSIMAVTKLEKNNEGLVTICISAGQKRPMIEFPFLEQTYHHFRNADGVMSVADASRLFCLGWIELMERLVTMVITNNYVRPAWMDRNNGGGGNWQNNRGGNGGGNGGNWGGNRNNGGNSGGGSWGGGGQQSSQKSSGDFSFDNDIPL
jgi:uncharacterized membrane protein YgcG